MLTRLALTLSLALTGCGASALHTHATVALVSAQTLATTEAAIVSACTIERDSCPDAACVERVRVDCMAAATAQDLATDAVRAYMGAIGAAALVDEGQHMAALLYAVELARVTWVALGESLEPLGLTLPAMGGVR